MTKQTNIEIFISHHHTQARLLMSFKKMCQQVRIDVFLAHEDIPINDHDIDTIEKAIRNCDHFIYICSEKSNNSSACQQEIGMAKGLNKNIITVLLDKNHPPKFFIQHPQALRCSDSELSCLYEKLYDKFNYSKINPVKKLQKLNYQGFIVNSSEKRYFSLKSSTWNDYGYYTSYEVILNGECLFIAKITRIDKSQINTQLPSKFKILSDQFISNTIMSSELEDKLSSMTIIEISEYKYMLNLVRKCLNDFRLHDNTQIKKYALNNEAINKSILRDQKKLRKKLELKHIN